jgi:signal transduction histidine kinase
MVDPGTALAQALTDEADRLVSADDPLAALQLHCGGTIPGAIAIPALAELVRKARRFGLRLARPIAAQDGQDAIRAWVEIGPRGDGQDGCAIALRHWQTAALPAEDTEAGLRRRAEVDRAIAELTARLDPQQVLLAVESDAPDLAGVVAAMRAGLGRPWTDFVGVAGDNHRLPMHWRLLDGAAVLIAGSPRGWRAGLLPQMVPGGEVTGFELFFTADTPLPDAPPAAPVAAQRAQLEMPGGERLIGRDLAPVLRQPIARIIANAETINSRLAGPLDDQYAQFAADIAAAGEHLLALVDDLADLEVIEADDFSTIPDVIDLADAARRAAGILSGRARSKRITIAGPAAGAELPARAEFRRVLQVLLNLIGNAIHYTPEQTRIHLELSHGGGRAELTVADQGPGLTPEQQARLFEKFERLGRSGDGGSGLGLYISRRLARAMGGDLTVASTPDQGARFTLSVPGVEQAD